MIAPPHILRPATTASKVYMAHSSSNILPIPSRYMAQLCCGRRILLWPRNPNLRTWDSAGGLIDRRNREVYQVGTPQSHQESLIVRKSFFYESPGSIHMRGKPRRPTTQPPSKFVDGMGDKEEYEKFTFSFYTEKAVSVHRLRCDRQRDPDGPHVLKAGKRTVFPECDILSKTPRGCRNARLQTARAL